MTDSTDKEHELSPAVEADDQAAPNRAVRLFKTVLRIGLLTYAIVLILLVVLESRLVYPGAYMDVPRREVPNVTTVNYRSADGTELTGRLFQHPENPNDKTRPTVLYFHGNGITAAYESTFIAKLGRELDANVMAAEFRGYDALSGSPHEAGVIADAFAARDFVCQHCGIQSNSLILYGQSLGGGCAVAVAADSGARMLVLDRTFDRMVDVAAARYWFIPIRLLMQNRYDSVDRLAAYSGPLVQVHGTADTLIPIGHGKRLHESAKCDSKRFIQIDGMGHNDAMPREDWQALVDQIKQWM
ncbi:MAG: alpha/beta hydrolase [Pirellulaceae bacterium]